MLGSGGRLVTLTGQCLASMFSFMQTSREHMFSMQGAKPWYFCMDAGLLQLAMLSDGLMFHFWARLEGTLD